jgi:MinD-like ATPase involved in chromosome partitioning or flagellar assembly
VSEASIAIAATGREWALGLHRFVADHGGARVRVRVMHPEQALEESYDVLVIDDVTSFLTAHLVQQVQQRDRKVLGVFDEPAGEHHLTRLGVNAVIRADADPEAFVAVIVDLAAQRTVDEEFAELIADLHKEDDEPPETPATRVIAVAGAGGGVGTTEVAVGLGTDLAMRGVATCLVDADDLASTVAQRLDLPLHPNIRTAMDYLQHGGGTVEDAVQRHTTGLRVLAGLPNVRDWVDIRAGVAVDVIGELATVLDIVLVNVSPIVEQMVLNPRGEGRFDTSRLVLGTVDEIVVTAAPTPMGIGRLIEWLADTHGVIGPTPIHVVVNRFEDGQFAKGEILAEIDDIVGPASVTFTPHDPRLARASWEGTVAPRSGFGRALQTLTDRLAGAPPRRRRRLRLGS